MKVFVVRSHMGIMEDPGEHWVGERFVPKSEYDQLMSVLRALSAEAVNGRKVLDGCTKTVADQVRAKLTT